VALYIKHHHERWDGWGYPGRLKGNQIPLGARIIAVADTFNAMVSERPHRPAMTFEQATKNLQAAAGSQLDPAAVAVLLDWFKTKQANASPGASLEPCWEMQQCPPSYAESCPVFGTTAPCWVEPDAWCKRQGQDCQTCPVYTEHLGRAGAGTIRKGKELKG
jgi:hypothetical protein